jgi:hypothetical protein
MLQVVFLVALQFVSLVVLWLPNPLSQAATDTFALYLSIDLVAFAIMSYIYRSRRNERAPRQAWLAIGYLALMVLLVSNLMLH